MQLIKDKWTKSDIEEYYESQKALIGSEKDRAFEQKIVNTRLFCYGKTSFKAKEWAKLIKKGNYLSFLDGVTIKTHFDSIVCAYLINGVKDFTEYEKRLDDFVITIDNWASCDTLKFNKQDREKLFALSEKYLKSPETFIRRVGVDIYFELYKDEKYLKSAFKLLDGLKDEKEYYVNMCGAWLLSFCFIKYREKTLDYLRHNDTNAFIINKGISKIKDSFRVSKEDKELINGFKV
ncbi:MAG: DNA alkylation repair protein [Clostridia bacterium]|nr:DNA alkylation repair protein [Clostridia bacterium]